MKQRIYPIGNEELQKEYRNTLKPFYGVLKTMDGYIKLGFLTGVTKFGKCVQRPEQSEGYLHAP